MTHNSTENSWHMVIFSPVPTGDAHCRTCTPDAGMVSKVALGSRHPQIASLSLSISSVSTTKPTATTTGKTENRRKRGGNVSLCSGALSARKVRPPFHHSGFRAFGLSYHHQLLHSTHPKSCQHLDWKIKFPPLFPRKFGSVLVWYGFCEKTFRRITMKVEIDQAQFLETDLSV